MNAFDVFESRTIVKAVLQMETALSVGGRASHEPSGTDLPVLRGVDGLPFIPGSSIKGVVRSNTERILRSLGQSNLNACDPLADPCVPANVKDELQRSAENLPENQREQDFSQAVWNKSCMACRLFGSPWFSSRLFFKDAHLLNGEMLPVVTQIRDGVGIDRDLGSARKNLKFDFEVTVPGTEFDIEILAENLEPWELGLFLAVLRTWQDSCLPVGGKSSRGPGWGKLQGLTIQRVDRSGLMDYLLKGEIPAGNPAEFLQDFQNHILPGRDEHA